MAEDDRRTIRSFVRRSGRMTPGQDRALREQWQRYGIDYANEELSLDELFGRASPRVLEIGFGDGDSLIAQAAADPDWDFLGIEVHRPGVGRCLMLAADAGLSNLRVVAHDAIEVMQHQIPDASLARINLYFPDPWPKKRHHKRRILQPDFLALAARKIERGGSLHIATDWTGYAEHIDELIASQSLFELAERREHDGGDALDRRETKFEKRGLKEGNRIRDWRLVRI